MTGFDSDLLIESDFRNKEVSLEDLDGERFFKVIFKNDDEYFDFLEKMNELKKEREIASDAELLIQIINEI